MNIQEIYKLAGAYMPDSNEDTGVPGFVFGDPDLHSHERAAAEKEHKAALKELARESDHRSTYESMGDQRWPKEARKVASIYDVAIEKLRQSAASKESE